MNPTADPLAGLRDIHLPDAIAFWPPAPLWWAAAGALILLGACSILVARRRRASLRRAALAELDAIERSFQATPDPGALAKRLSALLRRVALSHFERGEVAALHGNAWFEFLSEAGRNKGFPPELASGLERSVYAGPDRAPDRQQASAWITATRRWIGAVS